MINERKEKDINDIPYEVTLTDEEYLEYMRLKLKRSRENLKNGKVITLEEFDKEIEKLHELYLENERK